MSYNLLTDMIRLITLAQQSLSLSLSLSRWLSLDDEEKSETGCAGFEARVVRGYAPYSVGWNMTLTAQGRPLSSAEIVQRVFSKICPPLRPLFFFLFFLTTKTSPDNEVDPTTPNTKQQSPNHTMSSSQILPMAFAEL